jgi:hypothetical protein
MIFLLILTCFVPLRNLHMKARPQSKAIQRDALINAPKELAYLILLLELSIAALKTIAMMTLV